MMNYVILRPGELALKGANRGSFEQAMLENIRTQLGRHTGAACRRFWGRFYVGPTEDTSVLARACTKIFGIANVSPACRVASDPDRIAEAGCRIIGQALAHYPGEERVPFRVTVRRADKHFPLQSTDYQRELGGRVYRNFPRLQVDLENAMLDLGVEIRAEGTFLFLEKLAGAGGLPVGVEGRVLSLLSGGIDSPVASWAMMKRGCRVDFVHFDARPFTGTGSLEKVRTLARLLGEWQGGHRLTVVPFADCQVAMKDLPKPQYRTLIYRRFMLRIAARIAARTGALALVTGDSLGQVASQTLPNLAVVDDARGALPVMRPLIGQDKQETIARAKEIGTYDVSIRPFEDCCTLFQPEHPVTNGDPAVATAIEQDLDVEGLVAAAVQRSEQLRD